jgi:ribonucleoside-diphosphate reductase alpha chain
VERVVEKVVERIVERPLRRRLPDTRRSITHKFNVAGHEGYLTVGLYEDGMPGELFITMAKEGSTIGGLMDTIATLVSVALQYGVPVDSLVRKFEHVRFEPSGMTRNPEIPFAKSIVDYIFRWLAMEFIPGYRAANAPQKRAKPAAAPTALDSAAAAVAPAPQNPSAPAGEAVAPLPGPAALPLPELATGHLAPGTDLHEIRKNANGNGNGHGHRDEEHPRSDDGPTLELHPKLETLGGSLAANVKLIVAADPLSQQGAEMQADAPACDVCGSITVRSGTCYKCLNCGNSMWCS